MQFVDVKTDIAFKKIFGSEQHKEILIGLLNALLELEGDTCIKDVTLKNPWQPPDIPLLKETILDIKAVDNRGISFLVEMQVRDTNFFDKRALYYTAKAYTGQIKKGENYPKLNQVIFIGILDFNSFDGDNYLTRHLILNRDTLKQELRDSATASLMSLLVDADWIVESRNSSAALCGLLLQTTEFHAQQLRKGLGPYKRRLPSQHPFRHEHLLDHSKHRLGSGVQTDQSSAGLFPADCACKESSGRPYQQL